MCFMPFKQRIYRLCRDTCTVNKALKYKQKFIERMLPEC